MNGVIESITADSSVERDIWQICSADVDFWEQIVPFPAEVGVSGR